MAPMAGLAENRRQRGNARVRELEGGNDGIAQQQIGKRGFARISLAQNRHTQGRRKMAAADRKPRMMALTRVTPRPAFARSPAMPSSWPAKLASAGSPRANVSSIACIERMLSSALACWGECPAPGIGEHLVKSGIKVIFLWRLSFGFAAETRKSTCVPSFLSAGGAEAMSRGLVEIIGSIFAGKRKAEGPFHLPK